jgi:hypothetical protein
MLYFGTQLMLGGIRNARNGRDDRAGQSIAVKKLDRIVLNNQITDWRASQLAHLSDLERGAFQNPIKNLTNFSDSDSADSLTDSHAEHGARI